MSGNQLKKIYLTCLGQGHKEQTKHKDKYRNKIDRNIDRNIQSYSINSTR